MNGNVLGTLLSTRSELRQCILMLDRTQSRIAGPRPKDTQDKTTPVAIDNLAQVAGDISLLTCTLAKMLSDAHVMLCGAEEVETGATQGIGGSQLQNRY